MTREEQIIENAYMYESVARDEFRGTVESFKAGAHWADIHPKSPWISINEQLPQVGTLVLWKGYRDMLVAFRDEHNCINYKGGYFGTIHSLELDYWMPIPELPKGGKK